MKRKILATLAAIAVFAAVTAVFSQILQNSMDLPSRDPRQREGTLVYRRPETKPTEQTLPPQTLPPETVPPETEAAEILPPETEPAIERTYYDKVPLYDQTEYPHVLYRSGTLATSGSNITCLAMVASYLAGYEYLPDELADYFANYIGNSMQWLEYASDQLQLPWEKPANIDITIQALREGKIAIVLMNEKSLFSETPHFVVFTGITEDGKILVNDPYGPNYESWNLQNALSGGFRRSDLSGRYGGAWVYDPAAMPAEPFVYQPAANTDEFRYPGLEISQEDKDLLAKLICAEGESEPFEGQQAIAEVILNRIAADNFPSTMQGVIYAEGQFLAADHLYLESPTHTQYEAVERALYGPYVLPGDVVFFSQYAVNDNVWGTIGSHTFCHQW